MKVLVISGSMGAGKTTVLGEASDLLSARGIPHGVIDLDALGVVGINRPRAEALAMQNLRLVVQNYAAAGITRILIAEAVETSAARDRMCAAFGGVQVVVCRIRASVATMQARIRQREPGSSQNEFVARVATLDAILDAAAVEDFTVDNDDRPITDVAREILLRAGWIDA
jgi:predicted kinase